MGPIAFNRWNGCVIVISSAACAAIVVFKGWKIKHYVTAQLSCAFLHLKELGNTGGSILRWPETQYHIWSLLSIESKHKQESLYNKRKGITTYGAGVPHVDTANVSSMSDKAKLAMMEGNSQPLLKQLVLIGGGHTHAFIIKMFGMKPIPGVRLVLISRDVMTPYSGMLPGHVAGSYTRDECHIDLVKLGEFAGATLIHAEATGIDRKNKLVFLSNGQPAVPYDVLSIDIGCTPALPSSFKQKEAKTGNLPITPVKPIDGFAARWDSLLMRVLQSSTDKPFRVAVVGGGAGGVELALSMHARVLKELKALSRPSSHVKFTLLTRGATIMSSHNSRVQNEFKNILQKRGIDLVLNAEIKDAKSQSSKGLHEGGTLVYEGKDDGVAVTVEYESCIWCTSAKGAFWLKDTKLELDSKGFLYTNDYLQTTMDEDIFAAGDCASMKNYPRSKAGVFAVRAGPPLNVNLRRRLSGQPLIPYEPQESFLGIIGTGDESECIASKGTMCVNGSWLWGLKDWIDRKWMADYTTALADKKRSMADKMAPSIPSVATGGAALTILKESMMRCGGCGSKVGGSILSKVIRKLKKDDSKAIYKRSEVLVGLDSPDDCAIISAPSAGMGLVQTVDFFRTFISDPYVFGMVAANHALSDCHAMGAETVSALAIVVIPYSTPQIMEDILYRVMAGACKVLKDSKCTLVGGHTCEGKELSLGFAVNGLVEEKKALKKGGMRNGDHIILTKPVGTGTLFAANMRCEAAGRDVKAALDVMCQSNRNAGLILSEHGATACTDVTGFGVIGHLHEMASASDVSVTVNLNSIPLLSGAEDCIKKGIFSSLHEDNARLRKSLDISPENIVDSFKFPLLFDPQTAGGLLASIPAEHVEKCLKALKASGYTSATSVGRVGAKARNPIKIIS